MSNITFGNSVKKSFSSLFLEEIQAAIDEYISSNSEFQENFTVNNIEEGENEDDSALFIVYLENNNGDRQLAYCQYNEEEELYCDGIELE
jgi:hypothetical protein